MPRRDKREVEEREGSRKMGARKKKILYMEEMGVEIGEEKLEYWRY